MLKSKKNIKKKLVKVKPAIKKTMRDLSEYPGKGTWHNSISFKIGPCYEITFTGLITGCGAAQVYGIAATYSRSNPVDREILTKQFEESCQKLKFNGVGAVITTLGQGWYSVEGYLLSLGFEKISEYNNYRHCKHGSYKQRMYIIKL